jgi:hypothetical protein
MKYSIPIAVWRVAVAYLVTGLCALLGTFVSPGLVEAARPHLVEIAFVIAAAAIGVDLDAFKRANRQEATLSEIAENFRNRGLAIVAALALLPAVASAQELRYTLAYDLRHNQLSPVVGIEAASLRNVAGVRGLDLGVWFPLLGYSDRRVNYGAGLVAPLRLADNATLLIGGWGRVEPGAKPRAGLIVGVEVRG